MDVFIPLKKGMSKMIKKQTYILLGTALCYFYHSIVPNLTTLQHYDPSPIYSANHSMMPPNSHMSYLRKAYKKSMKPDHKRHFGINLTGFAQGACRARNHNGCQIFESDCSNSIPTSKELELGNFRGSPYAMGLFLGNDPNGNSIFDTNINTTQAPTISLFDNNNIQALTYDPTLPNSSTNGSINKTLLPSCLKEIAYVFAGIVDPFTGNTGTDMNTIFDSALMFDATTSGAVNTSLAIDSTVPSIFSEKKLEDDRTYFGAYSLALEYKKYGFRVELCAEFSEHVAFVMQTGFANIKHTTTGLFSLSSGNYDSSNPQNSLYGQLNTRADSGNGSPVSTPNTQIQSVFDRYISNNSDQILSCDCGISQEACNFDEYDIEDVRMFLCFKNTYGLDRYIKDEEPDEWPEMLFSPYIWGGGSFPASETRDYNKLLSLSFGNNGHPSIGGGIGMLFDFKDTIEVGFEGGATYFLSKEEVRPFPNHKLQRVLFPYRTQVTTEPGANWHFKAHMNAYQFLKHISFWATYEFIEHRKDHYRLCFNNTVNKTFTVTDTTTMPATVNTVGTRTEQIFVPEVLECNSDWRAQFINVGLIFDIQPGMQASIVWQQAISPRNAYYPISILGSFSFMF